MKPALLAALLLPASLMAAELPPLLEISSGLPGKQVRLTWPAVPGVRYRIERSDTLGAGSWKQVAMVEASAAEGLWLDPQPTVSNSFYRILQPQPEVFDVSPPLLGLTGGSITGRAQLLVDGCLRLTIEGQGDLLVPMSFHGNGEWEALVSGAFVPGSNVIITAITDTNGVVLLPLNIPLAVTETGRALDAPPSLPPASPVLLRRLNKKEVESYQPWDNDSLDEGVISNPLYEAQGLEVDNVLYASPHGHLKKGSNPLYQDAGMSGTNPLHTRMQAGAGGGMAVPTAKHAINTKGAGASAGRTLPPVSGMPGEVCVRNCDLALPCPAGPPLEWIRSYRSMRLVSSGQGIQWDFSYNIRVESIPAAAGPAASRVVVYDGGGRADVFYKQADGSFRCDGAFREGRFEGAAFVLTFEDKGTWTFHPFDRTVRQGKISSITDRNGVSLGCTYDSSGQLSTVDDAFGRSLLVEWGGSPARIVSVSTATTGGATVFAKVSYGYGASGEMLESASAPFVPGQPPVTGPTTYAYSSGSPDPRLNGNLLSVTDGAGRLLEGFTYAGTGNPQDIAYDTCATQDRNRQLGSGQLCYSSFELQSDGGYVMIENDELGRVCEMGFDRLHVLTRGRVYNGFATPGVPVTSSSNLPANPLRPGAPPFYQFTCRYNMDRLCTRVVHEDGSELRTVYDRDFRKDCPVRERGNEREVTLVSSSGDKRTVTREYLPGYGATQARRYIGLKGYLACDDNSGEAAAAAKFDEFGEGWARISRMAGFGEGWARISRMTGFGEGWARICGFDEFGEGWARLRYAGGGGRAQGVMGQKAKAWMVNNFEVHQVTALGQSTRSTFDSHGNCTAVDSPVAGRGLRFEHNALGQCTTSTVLDGATSFRDVFTYDAATHFPNAIIRDQDAGGSGLNLTRSYERDAQGRVNRIVDEEGYDWLYTHNAAGLCVKSESSGMPNRISMNVTLDAGGRIARCDVEHRAADGTLDTTNPAFSTFYVYDERARLKRVAVEEGAVDAGTLLTPDSLGIANFAVCDIEYDAAGQAVRMSTPAACRGQAEDLACDFSYDERGLLHRCVAGGTGNPAAVTTELNYNSRGGITVLDKLKPGAEVEILIGYDGFNRLHSVTDPMGNQLFHDYANDGSVTSSFYGELDDKPGSTGNILLAQQKTTLGYTLSDGYWNDWDDVLIADLHTAAHEAAHVVQQRAGVALRMAVDPFFGVQTEDDTCTVQRFTPGSSAGAVAETTVIDRSPSGLIRALRRGADQLMSCTYDSAGRLATTSNGACTTAYTRNKRGEVTVCGTTTHFLTVGVPDETFTTTAAYDALGRCVQTTAGAGNTLTWEFDSLGLMTMAQTAGGPTYRWVRDNTIPAMPVLSRVADADGDGDNEVLESWLSRCGELVSNRDSYGHTTSFTRDALGRVTRCDKPDGTFETVAYDALGALHETRSPDGSICTFTTDAMLRITGETWSNVPASVVALADRSLGYNGLGACVRATQGASHVSIAYDSCGNAISETSNGLTVARSFDSHGRNGITYPDGSSFAETRNALGQLLAVHALNATGTPQQPPVVQHAYAGERVWRRTQGNGVVTQYDYRSDNEAPLPGAPDFSFDACVRITVTDGAGILLADEVTKRDRARRITVRNSAFSAAQQPAGRSKNFSYDLLGRMTGCVTKRREAAGAPVLTESETSYALDLEGRRLSASGGANPGSYTQASTLPPGDQQMGQYTSWPGGAISWDDNGNITSLTTGGSGSTCDISCNSGYRIVAASNGGTGTGLVSYEYDALGRMASRTPQGGKKTVFCYDGTCCILEMQEDGSGSLATFRRITCPEGYAVCISTPGNPDYYPVAKNSSPNYRVCTCPDGYYISSAARNKVQHWGDPHENLNGRYVKGLFGSSRMENHGDPHEGGGKHIKDWSGLALHWGDPHENLNGRRRITCDDGWSTDGTATGRVQHWGDPHENLNGFALATDPSGHALERFDCDAAGKPIFLTADGLPTTAKSAIGPVRWMAPECLWEPELEMFLGPDATYCPDLGTTVTAAKIPAGFVTKKTFGQLAGKK